MLPLQPITMTTITRLPGRRRMTLATFMARPEQNGHKEELLEGFFVRSPTARWGHNRFALLLAEQLLPRIDRLGLGETCGPQTVVLGDASAPQPDLCVILKDRKHIIRDGYPRGAPDLVVEILSPTTRAHDLGLKKRLYAAHGVREYWLVDPDARTVTQHRLHRGRFDKGQTRRRSLRLRILPAVRIDLAAVWRSLAGA
jgi:Uma2 family endonuclease